MLSIEHLDEALVQQGFYIIDNFLDKQSLQELQQLSTILEVKNLYKKAKIGRQNDHQEAPEIRNDKICWLDEYTHKKSVNTFLEKIAAIVTKLNQSLFLGLVEIEAHFAIYQPGSYYKKHVDQFKNSKTRRISCVFYLNKDWQDDFGGELKLYNKEDRLITTVSPIANRFICFDSELPHEVLLTHKKRSSIAGWLKTRS